MSKARIGAKLRQIRIEKSWSLRKVAAAVQMDVALLSKMERGERRWNKELVIRLAELYEYDQAELLPLFLSDKVLYAIADEPCAMEALKAAEKQLLYQHSGKSERPLVLSALRATLARFPEIEKAWLFGSFARNEEGSESDIDLAIEANPAFSYFDLAEVQHCAEQALDRKVDIGFMDTFKPEVRAFVQEDLQLIYEKGQAS